MTLLNIDNRTNGLLTRKYESYGTNLSALLDSNIRRTRADIQERAIGILTTKEPRTLTAYSIISTFGVEVNPKIK